MTTVVLHIDQVLDAAADLLRNVSLQMALGGDMDPTNADCLLAMRDQMAQLLAMLGDGHKTLSGAYRFVHRSDFERMRRYEQEATIMLKNSPNGNAQQVVGITVAHPRPGSIEHTQRWRQEDLRYD